VTLFEQGNRLGGHSNTVDVQTTQGQFAVDTGFIVFNKANYPNLLALFKALEVSITPTNMSFAVSLDQGSLEYCGSGLKGLLAQPANAVKPSFIGMVRDILRFYKIATTAMEQLDDTVTLEQFLQQGGYGQAFINQHLLPMGAAIWSTPMDKMLGYPARTFLRFCNNHGLLQLKKRPQWYSVTGGSRTYVDQLSRKVNGKIIKNCGIRQIRRIGDKVHMLDSTGQKWQFDQVVLAIHADQALQLLVEPRTEEIELLRHFRFERNRAVLHSDIGLMPKRKAVWSCWNYMGNNKDTGHSLSVSYHMNQLQQLNTEQPLIVTLNPFIEPNNDMVHASYLYEHPVFDCNTIKAQRRLWQLQGKHRIWFCGAWCGYGFHEDGLQAGLTVAEALGQMHRPWLIDQMNDRLSLPDNWPNNAKLDHNPFT
jgi:predicted NAD/FAD-binding protein